jgi:autotransporter-associated beta strand protein
MMLTGRAALAADTSWILAANGGTTSPTAASGGGTGSWDTGANWYGGVNPDTAGRANIDNGGTVLITQSESTNNDITTGGYQNNVQANVQGGTYIQSAGTVTCNGWFRMAEGANDGGTYNLTGGTFVIPNGDFDLGEAAGSTGVFNMGPGTTFTFGNGTSYAPMRIGGNQVSAGGTGILNITGGTLNEISTLGYADIGVGGTGIMNISGGSFVTTADDLNVCDTGSYSGTLNVSGTGTVSLGGRYLYVGKFGGGTGIVNLNGGNVSTGCVSGVAYGATTGGSSTINWNGGMLTATGTGNSSNANGNNAVFMFDLSAVNIMAGGAVMNTGGYYTVINQALLNGTGGGIDGGLNVSGGATLVLGAKATGSTFTGPITVTGTTLRFASDSMLGVDPSSLATNDITLNNGELLNNSGTRLVLAGNRGIVINGTGYFEPGYGPGSPFNATAGTGGITINGPISGNGNLAVTFDAATILLNGSDTYTGSTIIGSTGATNNGNGYYNNPTASPTLQLGNTNAIPVGSPLIFNQHPNQAACIEVLDLNGYSPVFGPVTSATVNAVIDNSNGSPATITMGQGGTAGTVSTYAGAIRNSIGGAVSVVQTGPGTQVLSGTNTYSGSTTVLGGKLYVNGVIGTSSSQVIVAAGGTFGGSATVNSPALVQAGGTIESGYLGLGSLNLTQGLYFSGNGNIQIGSVSSAGTNALNVSGGTLDPGGNMVTINVASAAGILSVGSYYPLVDYTGSLGTNGFGGFELGSLPSRAVGQLYDNTTTDQIELLVTGVDYLVYTGAASAGNATAPFDTTTVNFKLHSNNSPVTYTDSPGDSVVFDDSATGPTSITVANVYHPTSLVFNNNTLSYSFSGAGGFGGTATIVQNGTATNIFGNSNSYTGSTIINAGTLQAGNASAFGTNSPVTIANASGATLALNGYNVSIGSLNGGGSAGGTVSLGSGTLTTGGLNASSIFGGSITGTGGITTTGTGTLTLSGSSTYTGLTTVGVTSTLNVTQVADTGTSNIGYGPVSVLGTFNYSGSGLSTTARAFNTTGGVIAVTNPAGTLALTGTLTATTTLNVTGPGTLDLTGTDTAVNFFPVGLANVVITGSLTTSGYSSIGGTTGNSPAGAIVSVLSGGSYIVNGDFNVGDVNNTFGTLNISSGAFVRGTTTFVGKTNTSTGVVNQTGGTYNQSGAGDFRIGGTGATTDATAVGIWSISGGTIYSASNFMVGAYGNGEVNISGTGAVTIAGGFPSIGRYSSGYGVMDVSGGSFSQTNTTTAMLVGEQGFGVLNVRGGTVSVVGSQANTTGLALGGNEANDTATGIVNLISGTLSVPRVLTEESSDTSIFNFNGGTLMANQSTTTFMQGLNNAYVYSGGAVIDSAGNQITIAQNLIAPTGQGVTSIAVASGGSGYTVAPIVQLSGGGGVGATAVAQMSGGVITGIIVTNPGVNYTSTPTVTLINGLSGGSGASFTPNLTNLNSGGLTVISSALNGVLTLTGSNTYTGPTNVSSGTLVIANDTALPTGNTVNVALSSLLVLPDQNTESSIAAFNVNGNVIVQNGNLATLTAQAAIGYNNGKWNGSGGITSTAAAGDPAHLHALGVIQNDDGTGTQTPLYGTFEGQISVDSDVLIKYTYYGDTNLDGKVDGSDYARIDNAYINNVTNPGAPLTGWFNGDFNYDGVINGSDYTLIDNAFNEQGAQITAQVAAQVGGSTVPEPATLSVIGIGAVGLLGRRRRAR